MKILIVLAHPEEQSMNGAMFRTAINVLEATGHEVKISELYKAQFNPVSGRHNFTTVSNAAYFKQPLEEENATEKAGFAPNINAEQEKVEWCDLMIWQFPLWWFSLPGVLKGWVDRVFAMGRFYGNDHLYANGVFKEKKALLSLTTGGVEDTFIKNGFNGDINAILKPIHRGILNFTGFNVLSPQIIYAPVRQSAEQRSEKLATWSNRLKTIFTEPAIEVGAY